MKPGQKFLVAAAGLLAIVTAIAFFMRQPDPMGSSPSAESIQPSESVAQPAVAAVESALGEIASPAKGAPSSGLLPDASAQKPVAPSMEPGWKQFANAEVVESREGQPDANGLVERIRVVKTDMKYPNVRIVEKVRASDPTGEPVSFTAAVADHMLVRVHDGLTEEKVATIAGQHGFSVRKKMLAPDTYLIAFGDVSIDALPQAMEAFNAEANAVQYAEPDMLVFASATMPNDPAFNQLWGLHQRTDKDIDAPEAWDLTQGSSNVVVAVIDTGIDYGHEDLAANMWRNPGEIPGNGIDDDGNGFRDDVYGWDFCNEDSDPYDDNSHGTHCAGTIGAVGNNGIGVAGVNWGVKLMAVKTMNSGGSGYISDAIDAVYYATRRGVRLTSNSWGYYGWLQSMKDAIDNAGTSNILFVAAAGNELNDNDTNPCYPSSFVSANIISVAATDADDDLAWFSNFGKTAVDLAAPGEYIYSTVLTAQGKYASYSGTSMATPHVAGAAALIAAYSPVLTAAQIKQRILDNTDRSPTLSGKTVSGGRLNLYKGLSGAVPLEPPAASSNLTATAYTNRVELAWTDNATNETAFVLERRSGSSGFTAIATLAANATGRTDTNVMGGVTYVYRVKATNAAGSSAYSPEASATVPGAADAWDPGNDAGAGAILLSPITATEASHGPHTLSGTDPVDWFKANLAAGSTYNFNSIGGSGDVYAELFRDAAGTQRVLADDDGGGGLMFMLEFTAGSTATYYIRVRTEPASGNAAYNMKYSLVASSNQPPTVALTSPASNAVYQVPATISIAANASDPDGSIAHVKFYNGATLLSTDADSPYAYSWSGVGAGSYTLKAVATDNAGLSTTSAPVPVVVNAQPAVTLTSPSNGASYMVGTAISIGAAALDTDGTITQVAFYDGATLLNTDTSSPYGYSWTSAAVGSHALYAVATDNQGGTGTSGTTTVSVVAAQPVLSVTPTNFNVQVLAGQNAAPGAFTVANSGSGTMNYGISESIAWLSISPTNGTSTGVANTHAITYSTAGLATGTYSGSITVTAAGASNSPKGITVSVRVNPTNNAYRIIAAPSGTNKIVEINTVNGSISPIFDLPFEVTWSDGMDFNPSDNHIYIAHRVSMSSNAFDFYQINLETKSTEMKRRITGIADGTAGGLGFSASGEIFIYAERSAFAQGTLYYMTDINGTLQSRGSSGTPSMLGGDHDNVRDVFWASDEWNAKVYQLNPANGAILWTSSSTWYTGNGPGNMMDMDIAPNGDVLVGATDDAPQLMRILKLDPQSGVWSNYLAITPELYGYRDFKFTTIPSANPFPVGSISGTIGYSGSQTGQIVVAAGPYTNKIASPGTYSIGSLPTPGTYSVSAFRDVNGNNQRDASEPYGEYVGNPINLTNNLSGANITMTDPSSALSISGNIAYGGSYTGSIVVTATSDSGSISTNWADDFESVTVSPYWTVTNWGGTGVAENRAGVGRSGGRAYAVGGNGSGNIFTFTHWRLPKVITKGRVTWWNYDPAAGSTVYYTHMGVLDVYSNGIAGVDLNDRGWGCNSNGTSACHFVPWVAGAGLNWKLRTVGWHKYEVRINGNSVSLYIDDELAKTGTTSNGIAQVYFGYHGYYCGTAAALFDDLTIVDEDAGTGLSRSVSIPAPGPYAITNLLPNLNYTVTAYRDINGNSGKDSFDPQGSYSNNPIYLTNSVTNAHITLTEPDSDGDGLTDAYEMGYGRYQIVTGTLTWVQAKADAEARGGHLGTITSENEWNAIKTQLEPQFQNFIRVWLGASDAEQEGNWKWITGETWSYTRWNPSEPRDGTQANYLDWMEKVSNYTWNDEGNLSAEPAYLFEIGYYTSPTDADTDDDGLTDGQEVNTYLTDPGNPDTDGDGLNDGAEVAAGTNPLDPDSDDDGLNDYYEVVTLPCLDPLDDDSDNDGIKDGAEVAAGSDPCSAGSGLFSIAGNFTYGGNRTGQIVVTASTVMPTNGLVAYYPFNGNANDESGNGNHGINYGAVATTDRFGSYLSAYDFDGISKYICVSNNSSLTLTNDLTFSVWIYQRGAPPNGYRIIDQITAGTGDGWLLDTYGNGSSGRRIRLQRGSIWSVGATDYSLSQWHHIVAIISGTNGTIYLDGKPDGTSNVGKISPNILDVFIGRPHPMSGSGNSEWFNGIIDDVCIYDRALSSNKVVQLFQGRQYSASIVEPGPYLITNVVGGLEYTVTAFMDCDGNGALNDDEPRGSYAANPVLVTNNVTGVDIELVVPSTGWTMRATHALAEYNSPGTNTVVCEVYFPTNQSLLGLGWTVGLPEGWALVSATGNGQPSVNSETGEILFSGPKLTNNPIRFTYNVSVPAGQSGPRSITGVVDYFLSGVPAWEVRMTEPDPLIVNPASPYHSSDFRNPKWVIDMQECNRTLSYWRSGGYGVRPGTVDGYAPNESSQDGSRHKADYQEPYWELDGEESLRVIGYWMAGGYHQDAAGDDGYAPGLSTNGAMGIMDIGDISAMSVAPATYVPGHQITLRGTLSYSNDIVGLLWKPQLPAGWTIVSVSANGGTPEVVDNEILFTSKLPPSPLEIIYVCNVPVGMSGDALVQTDVQLMRQGTANPQSLFGMMAPNMLQLDSDGDGLPDWVETNTRVYVSPTDTGTDPNNPDTDGDGVLDGDEIPAGTNPNQVGDSFRITSFGAKTGEFIMAVGTPYEVKWSSVAGKTYSVFRTTNLLDGFLILQSNVLATPPVNTFIDTLPPDPNASYSVGVE